MDIKTVDELAKKENIQLTGQKDAVVAGLSDWLVTLFNIFGDVVYA